MPLPVFANYDPSGTGVLDPNNIENFLGYFTWAQRPNAATVPVRSRFCCTDVGVGGMSCWWSDGTYWRPINGRVLLYQQSSLLASPITTLTGNGAAQDFILPDGAAATGGTGLAIPVGMLPVGATIVAAGLMRRLGNGGVSGNGLVKLGSNTVTINNVSFSAQTLAATVNQDYAPYAITGVVNSSSNLSQGFINLNSIGTNSVADRTTALNTAQINYVSYGISALTVDQVALLSYKLALEF